MTIDEARRQADDYAQARGWTLGDSEPESGGFLFRKAGEDFPAVLVRGNAVIALQRGIGRLWTQHRERFGPPTSEEQALASAVPGRYQRFEHGTIFWEGQIDLVYGEVSLGDKNPQSGRHA